ncbi:unnamed protein product [Ectocarpus sp. 12 AP-2014]
MPPHKKSASRKKAVYTFNFAGNPAWSCPLTCGQCTQLKPDGTRCKNRVCFGTPLCWSHNRKKYCVIIRESGETDAGKGLFTTEARGPDEWVCPYEGEVTNQHCINQWYVGNNTTAPYTECDYSSRNTQLVDRVCVDSSCERGIGAMANTRVIYIKDERTNTKVPTTAPESQHNCKTVIRRVAEGGDGSTIWLKTTRKVRANRELFVYYGPRYVLQDNHTTMRSAKTPISRPQCLAPRANPGRQARRSERWS